MLRIALLFAGLGVQTEKKSRTGQIAKRNASKYKDDSPGQNVSDVGRLLVPRGTLLPQRLWQDQVLNNQTRHTAAAALDLPAAPPATYGLSTASAIAGTTVSPVTGLDYRSGRRRWRRWHRWRTVLDRRKGFSSCRAAPRAKGLRRRTRGAARGTTSFRRRAVAAFTVAITVPGADARDKRRVAVSPLSELRGQWWRYTGIPRSGTGEHGGVGGILAAGIFVIDRAAQASLPFHLRGKAKNAAKGREDGRGGKGGGAVGRWE